MLSPFGPIQGLYFNNNPEPDDYEYDFKKDIDNIMDNMCNKNNIDYITIKASDKKTYYNILDELLKFNKNAIKVYSVSNDDDVIIIENDDSNI